LKVTIEPSRIRLVPSEDDPYIWKSLPEKQESFNKLFSKNLSELSTGAYRELHAGVGVIFEAIRATSTESVLSVQDSTMSMNVGFCNSP